MEKQAEHHNKTPQHVNTLPMEEGAANCQYWSQDNNEIMDESEQGAGSVVVVSEVGSASIVSGLTNPVVDQHHQLLQQQLEGYGQRGMSESPVSLIDSTTTDDTIDQDATITTDYQPIVATAFHQQQETVTATPNNTLLVHDSAPPEDIVSQHSVTPSAEDLTTDDENGLYTSDGQRLRSGSVVEKGDFIYVLDNTNTTPKRHNHQQQQLPRTPPTPAIPLAVDTPTQVPPGLQNNTTAHHQHQWSLTAQRHTAVHANHYNGDQLRSMVFDNQQHSATTPPHQQQTQHSPLNRQPIIVHAPTTSNNTIHHNNHSNTQQQQQHSHHQQHHTGRSSTGGAKETNRPPFVTGTANNSRTGSRQASPLHNSRRTGSPLRSLSPSTGHGTGVIGVPARLPSPQHQQRTTTRSSSRNHHHHHPHHGNGGGRASTGGKKKQAASAITSRSVSPNRFAGQATKVLASTTTTTTSHHKRSTSATKWKQSHHRGHKAVTSQPLVQGTHTAYPPPPVDPSSVVVGEESTHQF
eukprot:TRINITY_DN52460_c1_g1_i1.p1 TRINITY_DN52460_c1_g1~~TRINITY_DN52460_c1_g1_i1.p1  ORF type:complete len:576 (+),score=123.34 TRINITY_DN52460_c1_g1_i1:167-1729(+)